VTAVPPDPGAVGAVVPSELDEVRADRVVAVLFGVSRGVAKAAFDAGDVTVDGLVVPASRSLPAGAVVAARLPEPAPGLVPVAVPFVVRHEDPDLLVVDKPAGIVVHPGAGATGPTLAAGLTERFPELLDLVDRRGGIVHRLDRDTSGLLLVARTAVTHDALQEALRLREIGRTYLTMVAGVPEGARGTIEAPIGRDPRNPTRRAVVADGRPARTHIRRLAEWGDTALLEVSLETGRTHQIRVHLASIGHPVVGDRVYTGRHPSRRGDERADPGRQWLHAVRLELDHPVAGERLVVEAPLPDDLSRSLARLGPPRSGSLPATSSTDEPPTTVRRRSGGEP
jgi:23S rRNA pseudouridine1911/1915/1917 synthase